MTEIEIAGPYRHRIFGWEDPVTGEQHPERWVTLIVAEAVGTDGQAYSREVTCGIEVMVPGVAEVRILLLKRALKEHMKSMGVWAG